MNKTQKKKKKAKVTILNKDLQKPYFKHIEKKLETPDVFYSLDIIINEIKDLNIDFNKFFVKKRGPVNYTTDNIPLTGSDLDIYLAKNGDGWEKNNRRIHYYYKINFIKKFDIYLK